ncbi:MAG: DUF1428 family protein [Candidatus Nitrosopolaris sp.]
MISLVMAMNEDVNEDVNKTLKDSGNQILLVIGRIPKKNHDAALKIYNEADELLRKHGVLRREVFQLNNTDTYDDMGFTNITKTVSAGQDEEVWVEIQSYIDQQHMNEVGTKCARDENMGRLYKQSLDLLTPGSKYIMGEFGRLNG